MKIPPSGFPPGPYAARPGAAAGTPAPPPAETAFAPEAGSVAEPRGQAGGASQTACSGRDSSEAEDKSYSHAVRKLRSGQELSGYELSLLQKRDPGLYARAVQAQTARLELRRRLEQATTAEDFEQAAASIGAASPPASPAAAPENDALIVPGALQNEFRRFLPYIERAFSAGQPGRPSLPPDGRRRFPGGSR